MPEYIASGSHLFESNRYRFLILQRFKSDLHSVIKNRCVNIKHVLIIASQVLDVLEHLHDFGYAHSDIKAENLMIGECPADAVEVNDARNAAVFESVGRQSQRRQLRPHKQVKYNYDDEEDDNDKDDAADFDFDTKKRRRGAKAAAGPTPAAQKTRKKESKKAVDHIFLIDFGLASKFIDSNGVHHPFCMDQRRAHDGTLEFTSRDAHLGAHSRRSDLECLGYNMMFWTLGSLPWKDEKLMNQPEQVHRMKEIFMSDAREMLRLIYGPEVPTILGEFFHYVNMLTYDERPNYDNLRFMFRREFMHLGLKNADMHLNLTDLKKGLVDAAKAKFADHSTKIKNVRAIAKLGLLIPFADEKNASRNSSFGCRISPKNLRSKTDKLPNKRKKKRFSWAEILSQDPDQIARQRAEKEFERDQSTETPKKYEGRPTYAIIEIENRLKCKDNNNETQNEEEAATATPSIYKGYTKAMLDIVRKRQKSLLMPPQLHAPKSNEKDIETSTQQSVDKRGGGGGRRKSHPTKLETNAKNSSVARLHDNFYMRPKTGRKNAEPPPAPPQATAFAPQQLTPPNTTDESSCSSVATRSSESSYRCYTTNKKKQQRVRGGGGASNTTKQRRKQQSHYSKNGSTGTSRSSSHSSILSISSTNSYTTSSGISSSEYFDDDSCDVSTFSPIKTRTARQKTAGTKNRGRYAGKSHSN